MSETIRLRRAYKPIKVELDHDDKTLIYETVPLPRSVIKQIGEIERELFGADEDETIEKMGKVLDIRLRSTNGSKVKPSTIVKKLWMQDELTFPDAIGLYNDIQRDTVPN